MARVARRSGVEMLAYSAFSGWTHPVSARLRGAIFAAMGVSLIVAFSTYHPTDPSLDAASAEAAHNMMGAPGAMAADLGLQSLGLGAWLIAAMMVISGVIRLSQRDPAAFRWRTRWRVSVGFFGVLCLAALLAAPAPPVGWPLAQGLGGVWGEILLAAAGRLIAKAHLPGATWIAAILLGALGLGALALATGVRRLMLNTSDWLAARRDALKAALARPARVATPAKPKRARAEGEEDPAGPRR